MTYTVSATRTFATIEDAVAFATTTLSAGYDADKVEALEQGRRGEITLTTRDGDEVLIDIGPPLLPRQVELLASTASASGSTAATR